MTTKFFSDRHSEPKARTNETISPALWRAIVATISNVIEKDYMAGAFPASCPDGTVTCGTASAVLGDIIQAHFPDINKWPLEREKQLSLPATMDIIEFIHFHIEVPIQGDFHSYFGHFHLHSKEGGKALAQKEFRTTLNDLFARNRLIYELQDSGEVTRLVAPIMQELLAQPEFNTVDIELNTMLSVAKSKFISRDILQRSGAIEKLWDAWERIKTILIPEPNKKKQSMQALLMQVAPEQKFRERLDAEAAELTKIGNEFMIRHYETDKVAIRDSHHLDYLFFRLFSLINLCLTQIPKAPPQTPKPPSTSPSKDANDMSF